MKSRAFSLVELLVVIAIIVVLAGLILTVMGRSKASSTQAVCLSQVAQLGKGVFLYSEDNDGWVPPYSTESFKPPAPGTHLPDESGKFKSSLMPYVGSGDIFYCPSDTQRKKASQIVTSATSLHMSYTVGGAIFILRDPGKSFLKTNLGSSPLPADSLMLEDRGVPKANGGVMMYSPAHGDQICSVFFDLHSACLSGAQASEKNVKVIQAIGGVK